METGRSENDSKVHGKLAYSPAECAALLGISVCLCRELIRQGRIPALRLGERRLIIPKLALERMLAGQSEGKKGESDG
jgi:excisionase family DNA binding protein